MRPAALAIPPEPEIQDAARARGRVPLRYQDIAQDGRLMLRAVPSAVGEVVWQHLLKQHPVTTVMRDRGILAILSRIVVEGGGGPLAVRGPVEGAGCFQLAHSRGADGDVARLHLNIWVTLHAPRARTHGRPPPRAGERIQVGRIFAEHVFSRPFAPSAERRVLRFPEDSGLEPVPAAEHRRAASSALLDLPEAAQALEPAIRPDPATVVFGLGQTDSNQHVNSLVYPRLFEDASLRRFDELGHSTASLLPRFLDIRYRKPCFAGDRMQISLAAHRTQAGSLAAAGGFGAVGAPAPEAGRDSSAHCFVAMHFDGDSGGEAET